MDPNADLRDHKPGLCRAGRKERLTNGELAARHNLRSGFILKSIYCKECWTQCDVRLRSNTPVPGRAVTCLQRKHIDGHG